MSVQTSTNHSMELSPEWGRWIAEAKFSRLEDSQIIEILSSNGFSESSAVAALASLPIDPNFQAGMWVAQKLHKLESILDITRKLSALSPRYKTIERRLNLSRREFLEEYYSANRPVVLLDLVSNWRALSVWTPEYLSSTCGNEMVEVMAGRETDPDYEVNSDKHKTTMLFQDYVSRVLTADSSNDLYLVANNHFLEKDSARWLYQDLYIFPEYLDAGRLRGSVFLWFGPGGTVTPLHHDLMNIFMVQVYGWKRVTLISPDQTPWVYNNIGVYSEVNCENPDYERHPDFLNVNKIEITLGPGETLFLPVGWWHHVRSLDTSISVTFTNFIFPNDYAWNNPQGY